MAIAINGTLNIIERNGSRGAFNVAELDTDIGAFNVKHPVLDQFDPGSFSGQFIITKIYNKPNQWRGQVFINLYADLDWATLEIMAQSDKPEYSETLQMQGALEQVLDENPQEPDPVLQTVQNQGYADKTEAVIAESETDIHHLIAGQYEVIKFGDCVLADRQLLSDLKNLLRTNGYSPDLQTQTWRLR